MKLSLPIIFLRCVLCFVFYKVLILEGNNFVVFFIFAISLLFSLQPSARFFLACVPEFMKKIIVEFESGLSIEVFSLLGGIVVLTALEKYQRGESLLYIPVAFATVVFCFYFLMGPNRKS